MAAELAAEIGGTWKLDRSENFEAFLDKRGVGAIKKKIATSAKPTMVISAAGDTITVTVSFGPKTNKESFKLGEEFKPNSEDDVLKALPTWDSANKVFTTVLTPKDSKKSPATITRKIEGGELVQTMSVGDIVCKRIFKKA